MAKETKQRVNAINPANGKRQAGVMLLASKQIRFKAGLFNGPYYSYDEVLSYGTIHLRDKF